MVLESGARRYAAAAFEVALRDDRLDHWVEGVRDMSVLFTDPSAQRYFENSRIPLQQRYGVLDRALPALDEKVRNLGRLLIQKERTALAPAIARELEASVDEHNGIVHARVTTAVDLGDEGRRSLQKRLEEMTGKDVKMEALVDESIIGGIVTRIGDQLIDGSTRGRLVALRKRLEGQPS
ncbi:MAG: ATP synthase F1 subunit delta [Dehalococcoidia bacterium]|nr:ATP synthase F1 subunit delta [Dehalococcoidia bacterium]